MSDSPPAANPIMADPKKADGVEFRLRNITPAAVAVNNRSETRTAKNLSSKKPVIKRPTSPDAPITDSACADVPREIPRSCLLYTSIQTRVPGIQDVAECAVG